MTGTPVTRTVKATTEAYGFGKTKLYEWIKTGKVQIVKAGRRTLVVDESVRAALMSEAA